MPELTIRLLGSPQIELDGAPIEVDTRKAIALLAYLAVTRQVYQRATLAVLLWPDSDQAHALTALRRTLTTLNKATGKEWLAADRLTLSLNPDLPPDHRVWFDVERFQSCLAPCPHHDAVTPACAGCLPLLQAAVDLYRGDFLQGFTLADSAAFDEWQFFLADGLRRQLAEALQRLVDYYRRQVAYEPAIHYARQWLTLDSLHESAHQALMALYALAGQRAAALRQYQECERLLAAELNVAPQPATTDLYQRILQGEFEPAAAPEPTATLPANDKQALAKGVTPGLTLPAHNLPRLMTSFVGRDAEQREIHDLLDSPDCRLVTVVGPGGIGKTRLVVEVAHARLDRHKGVFFVPLSPVSSPDYLVQTIADAIHFTFYAGGRSHQLKKQLLNYLREKEMLLLLDNFEHLLDAAELLVEILRAAPGIKILVTSQERLNLMEEWLVEIYGLRCPSGNGHEEQCSAYDLFVQRAAQIHTGFSLSEAEKPYVGRICRLVGGMPLGIELASTWVRMLSCREIAQQIEQSLDFLATSLRNVPERHRSLRAVFEHSWRLLSEAERDVFRKLSVFRGGFAAPAAAYVAGVSLAGSLPLLLALANKSLLHRSETGRYEIPAVLRQYAREKFQSDLVTDAGREEVQARHCDYYAAFLHEHESHLKGEQVKTALAEIAAEIENVRQAWRWSVRLVRAPALRQALPAFALFYEMRGWLEEGAETVGLAAGSVAARQDEKLNDLLGQMQAVQGAFYVRLAQYDRGRELLEESLPWLRSSPDQASSLAFALTHLGMVAETAGRDSEARQLQEESLALYEAAGDEWGMAHVYNALGNVNHLLRRYDAARQFYQASLAIRQRIGDQRGLALCYHNLGNLNHSAGDYTAARSLYQKSVNIKRELGDRRGIAYSLNNLGYMAYLLADYTQAQRYLDESLALFKEVGDRRGIAYALTNLGNVIYAQGDYTNGREYYEESLAIFQEIGDRRGIAFSLEDIAKVAARLDERQEAWRLYRQALQAALEVQALAVIADTITGMAALVAQAGQPQTALHWLAAVLAGEPPNSPAHTRAHTLQTTLLTASAGLTTPPPGSTPSLETTATTALAHPYPPTPKT